MTNADITAASAGTVRIGDKQVNRVGLGTNRVTDTPEAHTLLKRAVELGVNFIDTAYRYAGGMSETTIGNTLAPYPEDLVVATKGGWDDTRPDEFRGLLEESLRRLRTDCIYLYQLHRVNPDVPIEDSVGMLKRFQDEGKIQHIGLSEVSVEQIQRAQTVANIASVQNEYNVVVRQHEDVLDYCTKQDIVFIPWFPLGGLRGDTAKVEQLVAEMAEKYQATPQQVALAWLLRRSPLMLPIPGTLSVAHLEDNLRAGALHLSTEDYNKLS
jgi:aryl-alcohol dehydrogenase-like predicted oxidoreductase